MQGKILDYNSDMKTGFLRDERENKYHFFIGDCTNPEKIKMGADVDFEHDGESATQITVIEKASNKSSAEANDTKKMSVKKSKKVVSVLLILILVLTIAALITVVIISEMQDLKSKKVEKKYESQISNIKKYLSEKDCSSAALEYKQAKNTRNEIYTYGRYYSIETHSQHAHALGIAECFANENDFENAVKMLDIKNANSADYFNRAAAIYQKSGDTETALEAHKRAQEIVQ
jgi:tetratricopeptide (TPR) repeat protein